MSKLVYGIGFNSKGKYKARVGKKNVGIYDIWSKLLKRCYDQKTQEKHPTYIGCTVSKEWYDYQNFAEWFYNHPYSALGYHLDKDILTHGNKIYSPKTCCLIPRELNNLFTDRRNHRGEYPQGVSLHKPSGKYLAHVMTNGVKKHLGCFTCPNEAHRVYKKAKEAHVKTKAIEWQDRIARDVFDALMSWELV